ncbi:MAG: sterol desaturase family protein [Planktomarina sp.]|jgi:sterol desaturase/sphingolipid hydroxylase (fatty acid hydroxylase superfamily)|nr:sterol desaturase family protein [Planktomarina sp.]MDT2057946.1 sterol desaturase family protein [Planktomarina sp.]MDT2078283.1 sterol desaturase family protein [Planktomarina sp.]|tara:strand:- start:76 stop:867 length:792 start_codon:yes stop_codon:yes gene_type:complete
MQNEATLRLVIFISLFVVLAAIEQLAPRRVRPHQARRWLTNWLFVIIDTITLRALALLLPFVAILAAADASTRGWGLLNIISLPGWLELIIVIMLLDLAIWLQHVLSHKIPVLWRIHQVHHSDIEFDVTTAIRFHPAEIALSMAFKIGLVYVLGPAAWTVVFFEILLNASAMFNHANIALPQWLDRVVRSILVTPDMHRIHHSVHRHEHDTNFGFALSWWDRLFGTYTQSPQDGHKAMKVGLHWQDLRPTRLLWSLAMPFFRK